MKASFRRHDLKDEEDSLWVNGGCLERGKGEGGVVRTKSTKTKTLDKAVLESAVILSAASKSITQMGNC